MKHLITPTTPYSFVADRLAIGGISAYGADLSPFSLALNVAKEFCAKGPSEDRVRGVPFVEIPLDDTTDVRVLRAQEATVLRGVEFVRYVHSAGRGVLVTCAQGRNRSALVVAEYLIQCGNRPSDIVAKIQARRADSLMNKAFVTWLHRPRA